MPRILRRSARQTPRSGRQRSSGATVLLPSHFRGRLDNNEALADAVIVSIAKRLTLLWIVLAASPALSEGQTNTGEISGVVRDAQGGVLPGATIQAEHVESGTRTERVTDEHGRYLLPSLRIGVYVVSVELVGFRRLVRDRVAVRLGQTLALDLTLEVGGLTEEVRVTAETPLLQTTNAEISDVIVNTQVVQIPLNGRNFLALAQLSDAVVLPPGGTRGDALQQAGPLPNVGGQRSGHNIYLLDGVKVTDELFNNLVINPSPSTGPTSICPIASSARTISDGLSARRIRAKCSLAPRSRSREFRRTTPRLSLST
jgi:Carboxypeptidase regulatory-like domain